MKYTKKNCNTLRKDICLKIYGDISKRIDDRIYELSLSKDLDAKVGPENDDTHIFGYKPILL